MLRAIIVDDESLARQELQFLVEGSGGVEVVAVGGNGLEAVDLVQRYQPDLTFLDVQMPGLDGFGVLKQLVDRHVPVAQVVFATAFDQYAVRAFEVNAVDYLLKPFDRDRVRQTVQRAQERAQRRIQERRAQPAELQSGEQVLDSKLDALLKLVEDAAVSPRANAGKVVVRAHNRLLLVEQKDITHATIGDGTITVFAAGIEGNANCRTLEELMERLDPAMFWRAHRSYLVNVQHIREVVPWFKSSYQLRLDDAKRTEIPVSRSQTKRLRELFDL